MLHFITLPVGNYELKNIVYYNVFYLAGFLYYRRLTRRQIALIAILPTVYTAVAFATGYAMPMQDHKFPFDWCYLMYGLTVICLLSLLLHSVKFKPNFLLNLWNRQGYVIYLWQALFFYIATYIKCKWVDALPSDLAKYIVLAPTVFLTATLFAIAYQKISSSKPQ